MDRAVTTENHPMPPEAHALLEWYDTHRRHLPWREDPTPYHIWVSEIMLQQTRVDTVIDYYHRFMRNLPDVRSLANAEEDTLLKLWQGLGYYSRIRNMKKAAVQIMTTYDGVIPSTPEQLKTLCGVGDYVAGAIASIAYGVREPAIDGNLLRVFSRMTNYDKSIRASAARKTAYAYYMGMLPADRPGDVNQALMDLGAMICLPNGRPLCECCPWEDRCLAHRKGREQNLPIREEKKPRRIEKRTVLRILCGGKMAVRRRPDTGLLAGLYEMPNEDGWLTEEEAAHACEALGFRVLEIRPLGASKHIFSHVEWRMQGYEIEAVIANESTDAKALENPRRQAEDRFKTWYIQSNEMTSTDPLPIIHSASVSAHGEECPQEAHRTNASSQPGAHRTNASTQSEASRASASNQLAGCRLVTPDDLRAGYSMPAAFRKYAEPFVRKEK